MTTKILKEYAAPFFSLKKDTAGFSEQFVTLTRLHGLKSIQAEALM
jgi:hypothetical protein